VGTPDFQNLRLIASVVPGLHQAQLAGAFASFIQNGFEPSDRLFSIEIPYQPVDFQSKIGIVRAKVMMGD
jgi:hypothetical protein